MSFSSKIKGSLNAGLAAANLRVDTLTREKEELARLKTLKSRGHFERPAFPLPQSFENSSAQIVFDNVGAHRERFETFQDIALNHVGYSFDNNYFGSPDAEVLYTLIRYFKPRRIIEVGSGHSTRVARQAIQDGGLSTWMLCIDPSPRIEIAQFCDESLVERVELGGASMRFRELGLGDFLFIDSSHEIKAGNDVVFLFLNVLPELRQGVIIHVHDVVLPWDYLANWVLDQRWPWTEQYLVQMLLTFSETFEVIWPGYFLQQTRPDFQTHFPFNAGRTAYSLWLRKRK